MVDKEQIIREILAERKYQDEKWGGPEHDDHHNDRDWIAFITDHAGRSLTWPWDGKKFRAQMIKVAAVAMAAVEWYDRHEGNKDDK